MVDKLKNATFEAVAAAGDNTVVPILWEGPEDRANVAGSASFFEMQGHVFLITAKHVMDEIDEAHAAWGEDFNYGVPDSRRWSEILTLSGKLWRADAAKKDVDIAILRLEDADVVKALASGWRFLTLDRIEFRVRPTDYYVHGFPGAWTTKRGDHLTSISVKYATSVYAGPIDMISSPLDRQVNLLLNHETRAIGSDAQTLELPPLQGISGSPVWAIQDGSGLWTPESQMKAVAVQTGYVRDRCVIATRWTVVAQLLKEIEPTLAGALDQAMTAQGIAVAPKKCP